jgi:histidinol phosphatase-like enzyme
MTDELLITKFLERNYTVITNNTTFVILDNNNKREMMVTDFGKHFRKIFGDFNVDDKNNIVFFNSWFSTKKLELSGKLYEIFDELDSNLKSRHQLDEAIKKCKKLYKDKYHVDFITNLCLDYYQQKYMVAKLDEYKLVFDTKLGSKSLIKNFEDNLILEHPKVIEFCKEYLNNWYSEKIIGDKVRDFLSQLVITLGVRNWVVTWIGHGPITKNKILDNFKNEGEFHVNHIMGMYDKWYEEKVIEASERAMKNSFC